MDQSECSGRRHCEPWNKGKLVGQKAPLRLKEISAIRIRLQLAERQRRQYVLDLTRIELSVKTFQEHNLVFHMPALVNGVGRFHPGIWHIQLEASASGSGKEYSASERLVIARPRLSSSTGGSGSIALWRYRPRTAGGRRPLEFRIADARAVNPDREVVALFPSAA